MYGFSKAEDMKRVIAATKRVEAIPLNNTGRSITGGPRATSPFSFVSLTKDGGDVGTSESAATVTYSVWPLGYPGSGTPLGTLIPWTYRPLVPGTVVVATFGIVMSASGTPKYIIGYCNELIDEGACGI